MKLIEVTEETLELSQRAYVHVGHIELDLAAGMVKIPLENSGHLPSPSVSLEIMQVRQRKNEQLPLFKAARHFGGDKTPLPPGVGYITAMFEVPATEVAAIAKGEEIVKIAGAVNYDTGFNKRDSSPFCFEYDITSYAKWDPCEVEQGFIRPRASDK